MLMIDSVFTYWTKRADEVNQKRLNNAIEQIKDGALVREIKLDVRDEKLFEIYSRLRAIDLHETLFERIFKI